MDDRSTNLTKKATIYHIEQQFERDRIRLPEKKQFNSKGNDLSLDITRDLRSNITQETIIKTEKQQFNLENNNLTWESTS